MHFSVVWFGLKVSHFCYVQWKVQHFLLANKPFVSSVWLDYVVLRSTHSSQLFLILLPNISSQCLISAPPKNIKKLWFSDVFRGYRKGNWLGMVHMEHGLEIVTLVVSTKKSLITSMVTCSRFIWITNSSDWRRVWTANLLHTKKLPNPLGHKANSRLGNYFICKIRNSNPPVVTGIFDPNKSQAQHSLKLIG